MSMKLDMSRDLSALPHFRRCNYALFVRTTTRCLSASPKRTKHVENAGCTRARALHAGEQCGAARSPGVKEFSTAPSDVLRVFFDMRNDVADLHDSHNNTTPYFLNLAPEPRYRLLPAEKKKKKI